MRCLDSALALSDHRITIQHHFVHIGGFWDCECFCLSLRSTLLSETCPKLVVMPYAKTGTCSSQLSCRVLLPDAQHVPPGVHLGST